MSFDDQEAADLLPGSHTCVGCGGMTFRKRDDALCPRCAFDAEALIERIELDCIDRDLQLITEFEAYYRQREVTSERLRTFKRPVFADRANRHDLAARNEAAFERDPFWTELRDAG